jgi:hypothetical protein
MCGVYKVLLPEGIEGGLLFVFEHEKHACQEDPPVFFAASRTMTSFLRSQIINLSSLAIVNYPVRPSLAV